MTGSGNGRRKILVVDDEPSIRESLELLLRSSFDVKTAPDGKKALEMVEADFPDLILLDIIMPNMDGMETLKALRDRSNNIPVIMLSATNTVRTAVQAMKYGAVDYLNKPFDVEELTSLIIQTLDCAQDSRVKEKVTQSRKYAEIEADFGPMVGRSAAMKDLFQKIEQVAQRDATVLVTGESGTGKELIAQRMHALSPRKDAPFVAINCAAIPETLIESELFGHEKGAFTHAVERRLGHFELADTGTLFLDEIGELSLHVQVKLLRFLQEQEFYRIGRAKPIKVNVRIVTATNKNLEELVQEGKFRQDLYYRINVINLNVPPLRDRFEDIPELVQHFVKKLAPIYRNRELTISQEGMESMIEYGWPGNVRELENMVESLMALSPNDTVSLEDLPRKILSHDTPESFRSAPVEVGMNFEEAEKKFETEMIVKALRKTKYVQTRAAELLGISRRILKYKMDKLGISDNPETDTAPQDSKPSDAPQTH